MFWRFNLILLLKPTVHPRQNFLFLPADKKENFVLERAVINLLCLYCLQEKWQSLQNTQAWMRGVDKKGSLRRLKSVRSSQGLREVMGCNEHLGKGGQEHPSQEGFEWEAKDLRAVTNWEGTKVVEERGNWWNRQGGGERWWYKLEGPQACEAGCVEGKFAIGKKVVLRLEKGHSLQCDQWQ